MRTFSNTLILLSTLSLVACGGPKDNGSEIWMFILEDWETDPVSQELSHNYLGAVADTVGSTDWTFTNLSDASGQLMFGQLVDRTYGKILVIEGEAYPGTDNNGQWVFEWQHNEFDDNIQTHRTGYSFDEQLTHTITTRYTLDLSADEANGTWELIDTVVQTFEETDQWNMNDTAVISGQTPTATYLRDANRDTIVNEPYESDCSAAKCQFTITTTHRSSAKVVAELTEFDIDEEAFDWLGNVEQQAGAGSGVPASGN